MKVAVGVSGGVDSAVTVRLLQLAGHETIGVTMTLGRAEEAATLAAARLAAEQLGIPLVVRDFAAVWRREVVDYVRFTYLAGATPNPCVRCNEMVKFALLPRLGLDELGCDAFATGHYARVESGRVFRGVDRGKDQSYFLYRVNPGVLAKTVLPLGGLTKPEVRARARAFGFAVADRGDSQDFCGGDAKSVVDAPDRPGEVVTVDGRAIGRHRGFWHYTVGQRKGLGIGGGTPWYVVRLEAEANRVIVAPAAGALCHEFALSDERWPGGKPASGETVSVKVRSGGEPKGPVTLEGCRCLSAAGLFGVAPGQSAVFYRGDELLGGGIIASDCKG